MKKEKIKINVIFQKMGKDFKANIKTLFVSNLLFSIPFIIIQVLLWAITTTSQGINVFLYLSPVLLLAPFYGGLVQVVKDIIVGKEVHSYKTFIKGVKQNIKQMTILGVIYYVALVMGYFAVTFYLQMGKSNPIFYVMFGVSILILAFLISLFFYMPLITITIDMKLKHILKNSALMALYEIPTNFVIMLSLAFVVAFISSVFIVLGSYVISMIFSCLLCLAILPIGITLIICSLTYPKIDRLIITKDTQVKEPIVKKVRNIDDDLSQMVFTQDMLKGKDEYIFVNGRMIKRSVIEKYLKEKEIALDE